MNKEFVEMKEILLQWNDLKMLDRRSQIVENFCNNLLNSWKGFRLKVESRIDDQQTSDQLGVFIHKTQARLSEISEVIFQYYKETEGEKFTILSEILLDIGRQLNETFVTFRLYYPSHFRTDIMVCSWTIFYNRSQASMIYKIIDLLESRNVDSSLIQIVRLHLQLIFEPAILRTLSWAELDYLIDLKEQLWGFCHLPEDSNDNCTLKLIRLLIQINFNSPLFYEYLVGCHERHIPKEWPLEEQELALLDLLQAVEKVNIENLNGLRPGPPIGQAFADSLKKSLEIIQISRKLYQHPDLSSNRQTWFYFDMNISLEDVAFDFRIQKEQKIISAKHLSGIIQFIKNHIKTERTKNPSESYLRNVFCSSDRIPPSIIRRARARYMQTVNYLDQKYGKLLHL